MTSGEDSKSEVHVETLEPVRAARFHAFSTTPETGAWKKANEWAGPKGLLRENADRRVFGRNSPPPSLGNEEYGYEFFIELERGSDYVDVAVIAGGLCAVLACRGVENLPEAWRRLYEWVKNSEYEVADHGLEHHLNPNESSLGRLSFNLWLPIR